ncbi:hybrid sensor histidine kinase/response regulator, partial [Burkholderia cepacia]|uniref:histidine kinase dimerization/phospho-acceptor domain-containing protein n=1 Tax=Burkholderia cepacia TaxID=292 RepID=UPI0034D34549|nr:hybrid sensor histidine kinase/response regulator [Burkholderia cepacia]
LLTPIVGTLDLLRRKADEPRTQKLLDGALQASERASTLVARLLAFARRQNLEARAVDVGELVDGMVDLIQRSIGPTIRLQSATDSDPAVALVDPNQLELALLNLSVNARDAMPDGGCLAIRTCRVAVPPGPAGLA